MASKEPQQQPEGAAAAPSAAGRLPPEPAVRPGTPVWEGLRLQLEKTMIESIDWMEAHRQAVRWAALGAAAGVAAFPAARLPADALMSPSLTTWHAVVAP